MWLINRLHIFIYAIANFVYEDFFNNLEDYKFGAALCCYLFMFNEKVRVHQLLNNSKNIFLCDLFWIFALPLSLSYFSEFKQNWQFSVGWILLEALFSSYELYIYFQADNQIKQNQIASPGPAAEISMGNKNKEPGRFYDFYP